MLHAYINYPVPHVTLHFDPSCGNIRQQRSPNERIFHLNVNTVSDVLGRFVNREVRFAAQRGFNDAWFFVDFGDATFEEAVVLYIQQLIGRRYRPLREAPVSRHCGLR